MEYYYIQFAEQSAPVQNNRLHLTMANKRRNTEVAGRKTASAAAKILCSPYSSKAEKSAAAAELAQRPSRTSKRNPEVASKKIASIAAKILRSPHSSPAAKRAAASALTQRASKA